MQQLGCALQLLVSRLLIPCFVGQTQLDTNLVCARPPARAAARVPSAAAVRQMLWELLFSGEALGGELLLVSRAAAERPQQGPGRA